MELITEMIYTRLLETYPLQSPGQFRNHPLRAVYFDSLEEEWEDGILYLVEDPAREPQCLRSQAKAAFFLSIPWLQSHSIRYREPSIPNDRAT